MTGLSDRYARIIDYLRISVTDKCMLRCLYCMPLDGVARVLHSDILRYEEIVRIVRVGARLGLRKIRLTGGEPLLRRNLCSLISSLRKIEGIEEISLTTNGILLERLAHDLREAGLDRVNVSIDSFDPEKYREITRGGDLGAVLSGLDAARRAGLLPLKINMVPMRGINDQEVESFAEKTLVSDIHVRFIECMPTAGAGFWNADRFISTDEIKERIGRLGALTPVRMRRHGPSKYFRLPGAPGVIGFISALSHHFCGDCSRLRLTADGKIRPCLFSESEIDLRTAVRSSASDEELERLLRLAVAIKPEGHRIGKPRADADAEPEKRPMSRIGG